MNHLRINFAQPQPSLNAWKPAWSMALLGIGLISLGIATWQYQHTTQANALLQNTRDALRQRAQTTPSNTPPTADLLAQVAQANASYALTQTPWEKIFTALEAARNQHDSSIALLSIRADAAKHELSLLGEAKNFKALSSFSAALSDTPLFYQVTLANDKLGTGAPIVVVFELRLNWHNTAAVQP